LTATNRPYAAIRDGLILLAIWSMIVLPGCGDGRPKRVPISGQVLIDGKPLTTGDLRLVPADARPAWAKIGPDGRFTLKTFEDGDGAVLGTHPVAIRATEMLGPKKIKWHAPKKYANDRTSGLTATIDGPTDSLVIELTWDGGKPFIEIIEPEAGASSMY